MRGVAERLVEDQIGERAHQAVLAHQWQELMRLNHAEDRMRPADQRLGAHDSVGLQVDLRLIQHGQGAMGDCLAQIAEQSHLDQSTARRLHIGGGERRGAVVGHVHVGAERLQATAEPFRRIHRRISLFEQRRSGQISVLESGDRQSGTGPHEDHLVVCAERSLERLHDLVDDQMGVLPGIFDQHCEFVTTDPGNGVTGSHATHQPLGGLHQEGIAGRMAQVVVDELEVVEVHRQDGDRTLIAMIKLHHMIETVVEQHAVGQIRQRVAQCPVGRAM